jgi:hypothetical protein
MLRRVTSLTCLNVSDEPAEYIFIIQGFYTEEENYKT